MTHYDGDRIGWERVLRALCVGAIPNDVTLTAVAACFV